MIGRDGHEPMAQELDPHADASQPMAYQIRIKGQLGSRWADSFEGLTITLDGGDTLITGPVVDQAALHGLLKRVRNLGMPLVSVSPHPPDVGRTHSDYGERTNGRPMRAIVCTNYGPPEVLRLRDVRKPVPKDNEVLVRIRATTVSTADCELRRFDFAPWIWVPMRLAFGIRRPRRRVLGQELAGDVEVVGKDVGSLRKGDRVFAATGIPLGAYAEYICLRENPQTGATATMPANLDYAEAAAVPYGGGEALSFLRKANVRSGQRILVNGAGGSFGTFAVQLAKDLGAHVTAVDSAPKLEMLRTIGADRVMDYAREDFTEGPETYDVIFDVVRGTPSARVVRRLTETGWLLMANPGFVQIVRARWAARRSRKRVSFIPSGFTSEDLAYLRDLVEAGRLHPVVDRRFPLEQMVEAHRYAETGQKLGNIVVDVGGTP